MNKFFPVKDTTNKRTILGMEFLQVEDSRSCTLTQKNYITELATKHDLLNAKPVLLPITLGWSSKDSPLLTAVDIKDYQIIVGEIGYAINTHPECAYVYSLLTRDMSKPTKQHYCLAKTVLNYLFTNCEKGIYYSKNDWEPAMFSDSAFGDDIKTGRSTSGYVIKLVKDSGAIACAANLQKSVSLSTCEAEIRALSIAGKNGLWLMKLFKEMLPEIKFDPLKIFGDNQSAIALSSNLNGVTYRTRHLSRLDLFIRELITDKIVTIHYLPSEQMPADILTKALPKQVFIEHSANIRGSSRIQKSKVFGGEENG